MDDKRISEIAHELAAIATAGKFYTKNKFDTEHYENILALARELLTIGTDITPEQAAELLEGNDGYQTPKVETRAVIFNEEEKILLVRDFDGRWNPVDLRQHDQGSARGDRSYGRAVPSGCRLRPQEEQQRELFLLHLQVLRALQKPRRKLCPEYRDDGDGVFCP